MCSVCREGKVFNSEDGYANYKIIDNKLFVYYSAYSSDSSFQEVIKIKFCPMCGHELY